MLISAEAEDGRVGVTKACESLIKVAIDVNPNKYFQLGAHLSLVERDELVAFLKQHIDVFA